MINFFNSLVVTVIGGIIATVVGGIIVAIIKYKYFPHLQSSSNKDEGLFTHNKVNKTSLIDIIKKNIRIFTIISCSIVMIIALFVSGIYLYNESILTSKPQSPAPKSTLPRPPTPPRATAPLEPAQQERPSSSLPLMVSKLSTEQPPKRTVPEQLKPYNKTGGYAFTTSTGEVIQVEISEPILKDRILAALNSFESTKMEPHPTKILVISCVNKNIIYSPSPKRVVELTYEFRAQEVGANQRPITGVSKGEEGLIGQSDTGEALQKAINNAVKDLRKKLAIN